MKWVRIQQVPGAGVEVTRIAAQPQMVREQPFYVEQRVLLARSALV